MSRIYILTSRLTSGGAERAAANLSIGLSQLDYEVEIITIYSSPVDYTYGGKYRCLNFIMNDQLPFLGKVKKFILNFEP